MPIDRTAFSCGSFAQADQAAAGLAMGASERLRYSRELSLRAMGFDPAHPPLLDRTAFSMGNQEERSRQRGEL